MVPWLGAAFNLVSAFPLDVGNDATYRDITVVVDVGVSLSCRSKDMYYICVWVKCGETVERVI